MNVKQKKNHLLEAILKILAVEKTGQILDLGCGSGMYAIGLHKMGFNVTAADFNQENFKFHKDIKFKKCNLLEKLPFPDSSFDYLIFLETIEHLERPFDIIEELGRVLKPNGVLILSTPNILNLRSRMRFLFEGCFDFFREPIIDLQEHYIGTIENMHIIPWRYHELEYMLYRKGFAVKKVYADRIDKGLMPLYFLLWPFMQIQRRLKEIKSLKKKTLDFRRINNILFLKELLFGRHLIVKAENLKEVSQSFGHYVKREIQRYNPRWNLVNKNGVEVGVTRRFAAKTAKFSPKNSLCNLAEPGDNTSTYQKELKSSRHMTALLEKDYTIYLDHLDEFLQDHRGDFVLIKNQKVVDFFPTYEKALKSGLKRFGNVPFFIKVVQQEEEVHFFHQGILS